MLKPKTTAATIATTTVLALTAMAFAVPGMAAVERLPDKLLARQTNMILGVDGAAYLPYKPSVVEWVQQELKQRDLYAGEMDGELDEQTKKAIADFQRSQGLHASGVPSPFTRHALRVRGA